MIPTYNTHKLSYKQYQLILKFIKLIETNRPRNSKEASENINELKSIIGNGIYSDTQQIKLNQTRKSYIEYMKNKQSR